MECELELASQRDCKECGLVLSKGGKRFLVMHAMLSYICTLFSLFYQMLLSFSFLSSFTFFSHFLIYFALIFVLPIHGHCSLFLHRSFYPYFYTFALIFIHSSVRYRHLAIQHIVHYLLTMFNWTQSH